MTDITLPMPAPIRVRIKRRIATFLALIGLALPVAAALAAPIEDCRTVAGDFDPKDFSSKDFDVTREVCGQSARATVLVRKAASALRDFIRAH